MRHSDCQSLSNAAVAKIELRQKALNLTRRDLLLRFAKALTTSEGSRASGSAKMRLDRVFNPKLRRPLSEATKAALARSLDWTLEEFDQHVLKTRKRRLTTAKDQSRKEPPEMDRFSSVIEHLQSVGDSLDETAKRLAGIVEELARKGTARPGDSGNA